MTILLLIFNVGVASAKTPTARKPQSDDRYVYGCVFNGLQNGRLTQLYDFPFSAPAKNETDSTAAFSDRMTKLVIELARNGTINVRLYDVFNKSRPIFSLSKKIEGLNITQGKFAAVKIQAKAAMKHSLPFDMYALECE